MMKKARCRLYRGQVVCAIVVMAVAVFGCASPEVEHIETASVGSEVRDSVSSVSKISTERLVGKMRVTVEADSELSYTAFKLTDPLRLVLDLPNIDTSNISEVSYQDAFPLTRITPFQFTDGETVNSRIEIALSRIVPYQVFSDANRLFIDLETPMQETDITSAPSALIPPGFEELTPLTPKTETPLVVEAPAPIVIEAKPGGVQALSIGNVPDIQSVTQTQTEALPTIQIEQPPKTVGGVSPLPAMTGEAAGSMIKDLQIVKSTKTTSLVVSSDILPEFEIKRSQNPPRITIDLKHSDLPAGGEKVVVPDSIDTTVKQARLFQLRRSPDGTDNVVRILVDLLRPTAHEVITEPGKLMVNLQNQRVFTQAEMTGTGGVVEVPLTTGIGSVLDGSGELDNDALVASDPTIRAPKTGDEQEYKGQPVSLHFQEADVLDVLQVIAEVSGLNLVVHPQVQGTVTVHLTNIPWDQALDIILKMNNLSVEIEGTILRVAQSSIFQNEIAQRIAQQQQQIQARRIQEELEPLDTRLITINFADPGAIVGVIDDYFSGALPDNQQDNRRGTITVDSRTKTLIVQDTAANISKIEGIVATLDRRTPQVMIEAKIVTLSTFYVKELGIQWLANFNVDAQHGNSLPFRWPFSVNGQDADGGTSSFGVNLPGVTTPIGTTGWLRFGSIDDIFTLFAKIDAAEIDNKAKTLSQPKVFTQDNVAATVTAQQTRTIPSFGDNTESTTVTAPLTLSVTPRISNDGYITMVVNVNNTIFVDTGNLSSLATSGQTLTSQVTVKDGSTVVVGGIFVTSDEDNFAGVPGLHKIPILGHLFKSKMPNSKGQQELLVFLTPRILDRNIVNEEQQSSDVSLSY